MTSVVGYWTDDKIEKLKKLWGEGLSASQIADRLGYTTRNAVISKVHRLGLSGRATTVRMKGKRRSQAQYQQAKSKLKPLDRPAGNVKSQGPKMPDIPREPWTPPAPRVFDPAKLVTFADLEDHHCRWPIGDPRTAELRFCGAPKVVGLPYCHDCAKRAYAPKGIATAPERVTHWRHGSLGGGSDPQAVKAVSEALEEKEDA